jgi:hypothetical protein
MYEDDTASNGITVGTVVRDEPLSRTKRTRTQELFGRLNFGSESTERSGSFVVEG